MAARRPLTWISGALAELPVGDVVAGHAWHFGSGEPNAAAGAPGEYYVEANNRLWVKGASAWTYTGVQYGSVAAVDEKAVLVDADVLSIGDSANNLQMRRITAADFRAWAASWPINTATAAALSGKVGTTGDQSITGSFTLISSRVAGLAPHALFVGAKEAGQAGSVSFRRPNATLQNLFTWETGDPNSGGKADGFIGTRAGITNKLFVFSGNASDADASLYIGAGELGIAEARYLSDPAIRLGTSGAGDFRGPLRTGQYTLSTLPSASAYTGFYITVSDASGGAKLCRSNGSVWQIANTTTTVS